MDEVQEGQVGRTVKYNGKEYWINEDILDAYSRREDHINVHFDFDVEKLKSSNFYRWYTTSPKPLIFGLTVT